MVAKYGPSLKNVASSDRMGGSEHKLKYKKLHLNTWSNIQTVRVVKHCNRLPREAVES